MPYFRDDSPETLNPEIEQLVALAFGSPKMTSPSFDQYLRLSPEEQVREDHLYWKRLTDPQYVAFLAGLFRMSLREMERSHRCPPGARVRLPRVRMRAGMKPDDAGFRINRR